MYPLYKTHVFAENGGWAWELRETYSNNPKIYCWGWHTEEATVKQMAAECLKFSNYNGWQAWWERKLL